MTGLSTRMRRGLWHALHALRLGPAALAGMLLAACGSGGGSRPAAPPEQIERIGALDLITHSGAERGGDAARRDWQHAAHWSLRWQGQPLAIDTLGGLFGDKPTQLTRINAAFVIVRGGAVPELLVNVGDPNNTSAFHLVRQQGGAVQVRLLCIVSGGDNAVGWAQHVVRQGGSERAAAGLPGRTEWLHGPRQATLRAAADTDADAGGRYLMLGRRCLFDTRAGTVRWLPDHPSQGPAIVSPDGTRLARLAEAESSGGGLTPLLQVAEALSLPEGIVAGSVAAHQAMRQRAGAGITQRIALQRTRMRFPTLGEVDAAWVLHHFRWARGEQGERLVERRDYTALAHRGVYRDNGAQYRIEALNGGLRQQLVDFLVQRFDGRPVAGGADAYGAAVQVGTQTVTVGDDGFYIAPAGKPYHPGQPEDPAVQRGVIRRLGEAFDTELASGRLDPLFTDAPR